MHKNFSTLMPMLMMVLMTSIYCSLPAIAQIDTSSDPTFTKHYVAQNDSGDEEQSEESAQNEDSGQSEEVSQSESGEQSDGSEESAGSGSGERVGLATLFVQFIGMGLVVLLLLGMSISSTFLFCGLVWKIGMIARGGKKPDIG